MWIVTLLVLFGFKSMWNHWMWGFLMGAFFLAFMGKWVRRSGVITGAEWMITRFGDGPAGSLARTTYALMAVVTLAAFIGYSFEGIGKFVSVYVGIDPNYCAVAMFALTTLYVLLGGLYSVVVTDIIQTVILTAASVVIAVIAYQRVTPETLGQLEAGWSSVMPVWQIENAAALPKDYQGYEFFGLLCIAWVLKGVFLNLGGPAQMADFQRFLAARSPRDAAKVGAGWSVFLIVRWAMATGIALMAIQAGAKIIDDPETFMPWVLKDMPIGFRGLVIAGLLAAFMAAFSAMVNAGASYMVRDFYQPLIAPNASKRHLVGASYASTALLVAVGILIGIMANSVGAVFTWIMMDLGAAFAIPNVLRWYWWRLNGWGYAAGTLAGMAAALVTPWVPGIQAPYISFPLVCAVSLIGTLAGTWLTRPTDEAHLIGFYRHVRPFGLWGRIRRKAGLSEAEQNAASENPWLALLNVVLGGVAILGAYLSPMYLVGHWHGWALAWFGVSAVSVAALYFTWYRTLPADEPTPP